MEHLIADISPSKLARIIIHVLTMKKLECKSCASKVILDAAIRILLSDNDCAIFRNGFDSEVTSSISKALSKPDHIQNKDIDVKKTRGITADQWKTDLPKLLHPDTPLYNNNANNKQPRTAEKQLIRETKEKTVEKLLPSKNTLLQESAPRKMPLLPLPKDAYPLKHQIDTVPIQIRRKVLLPFPPSHCKWRESNNPAVVDKKENQYLTFYYHHPSIRDIYSSSVNGSHNFANSHLQERGFQKL